MSESRDLPRIEKRWNADRRRSRRRRGPDWWFIGWVLVLLIPVQVLGCLAVSRWANGVVDRAFQPIEQDVAKAQREAEKNAAEAQEIFRKMLPPKRTAN